MFLSCETDIETINTITHKSNLPGLSAKNIEIIRTDSARIILKISAPELHRYETKKKPYVIFPKGIKVLYYNNYPYVESSLSANYAKHYEQTQLWEAKYDVVAINSEGEILNTEHLIWDEKKEIIYSDKFVRITTKDEIIYGEGFEADEKFTKWKIKKVKGTINYKDE